MKKLGLLMMPLMAISLLASCGEKIIKPLVPPRIDLYKKKIEYDNTGKNIVFTTEYTYDDKSLCIKEIKTKPNDLNYKQVTEYSYDEHENVIDYYNASYDGEEIEFQHWEHHDYTYDKQGRMTKDLSKTSYDNVDWQFYKCYEFEYKQNTVITKDCREDGSLIWTTTEKYNKQGYLISEKKIWVPSEHEYQNWEYVYTVDKNGCATKIEDFNISESGEREELVEAANITYLNNLWYRSLKEATTYYVEGEEYYTTGEREYDSKNRITLYKEYKGKEEGDLYIFYYTYEY